MWTNKWFFGQGKITALKNVFRNLEGKILFVEEKSQQGFVESSVKGRRRGAEAHTLMDV